MVLKNTSSTLVPKMSDQEERNVELIKKHIKSYPDFPKPGILFQFSIWKVNICVCVTCFYLQGYIFCIAKTRHI